MLAGCSAAPTGPGPSPSSSGASSAAPPPVPADGVSLEQLGFDNGPTDRIFLPRGVSLITSADLATSVTLVIDQPPAERVAGYLRQSLPAAGFKIDSDRGATLIFSGFGWSGSFTGAADSSALVLRPA